MTLDIFKARNGDIVLDEIRHEDLEEIANGQALFYVSLSNSKKPKGERAVLYAGHAMTAGAVSDGGICILRLTARGNPRMDVLYPGNLGPDGSCALFRTRPFPAGDYRNLAAWTKWDRT